MTYVKLIEVVHQTKNYVEVIATVNTDGQEYLGIAEFTLSFGDKLPEDEDELTQFLEQMNLTWDLYIPHYDDELIPA